VPSTRGFTPAVRHKTVGMNTLDLPLLRPDGTTAPLSACLTTPKTMVVFTRHLN
jgi:hypothetical protein